ncbi:hypothetical protein GCM10011571_33040 [Marinithermofilum abyssi]|uniref:Uncharacterized protein n=1 Tax=Marinithermofilum abyssi TaxID=1571185 RepID=A0A8J2YEF7_9BACL|nr:hypothetical protein [Marinithermofilum abyssi]GGE28330.1 hypothetical protein GCM10011571_33040 [Marinithermofilum abyssi]
MDLPDSVGRTLFIGIMKRILNIQMDLDDYKYTYDPSQRREILNEFREIQESLAFFQSHVRLYGNPILVKELHMVNDQIQALIKKSKENVETTEIRELQHSGDHSPRD